ncbi:MAG: hypothetical protein H6837_08790 [Planctomycetes bacterium]|nr:hypothetical protein [Planctomycetota bacterium]
MTPAAKILLAIGASALITTIGLVAFGHQVEAKPSGDVGSQPAPAPASEPRIQGTELPSARVAEPLQVTRHVPSPGSGHGMISGRIGVSTRLLRDFYRYTIVVEEEVNRAARKPSDPPPFLRKATFPVDLSAGTPFFDIDDIPFSTHPYRVFVIADGMNGSSALTYIDAAHPHGRDGEVHLVLTPGSYFAVALLDQRRSPRGGLDVYMRPVGAALGARKTLLGRTGGDGRVLFENVLQGEYEVLVGDTTQPMAPAKRVLVRGVTTVAADGRPDTQAVTIEVPDGKHVTIEVSGRWGGVVENAELKAWQLEIKRYFEFTGKTDRDGRYVLKNMPYGKYQISVGSAGHGRRDVRFEVKPDDGLQEQVVKIEMPR